MFAKKTRKKSHRKILGLLIFRDFIRSLLSVMTYDLLLWNLKPKLGSLHSLIYMLSAYPSAPPSFILELTLSPLLSKFSFSIIRTFLNLRTDKSEFSSNQLRYNFELRNFRTINYMFENRDLSMRRWWRYPR